MVHTARVPDSFREAVLHSLEHLSNTSPALLLSGESSFFLHQNHKLVGHEQRSLKTEGNSECEGVELSVAFATPTVIQFQDRDVGGKEGRGREGKGKGRMEGEERGLGGSS